MITLPIQKVSDRDKTAKWFEECATAAISIALNDDNSIALSSERKQINLDLYDGIIDEKELKKHFDTMNIYNDDYTPSFKNFAVIKNKIDLLHGEYLERNEEYGVAVVDFNSLARKEEERIEKLNKTLTDVLTDKISDKEELKKKLKLLRPDRYTSNVEKANNKLLDIIKKSNNVPYLKAEGFRESFILAQAIFHVGVRNGNLFVRKCDSLNTFTVRSGASNDIKDAEIIAEVRYLPVGKIVDEYSEHLSNKQFKQIVAGDVKDGTDLGMSNAEYHLYHQRVEGDDPSGFMVTGGQGKSGTIVDEYGNIRVVDVSWKGFRKLYKKKYYDDNGEVQYDYVSEYYDVDKDKGEELTTRYVTEWYRATVIGKQIVINAVVKEPRVSSVTNPFDSYSGYVGGYFNVGNNRAKSLIDFVAPYIYMINLYYARIEDIASKNMGKIIELDLHNIPEGWTVTKVLRFMKMHGIRVKDSFKAGDRGAAQGKLAGQYNSSSKPLDMEIGNSIMHLMSVIDRAESQIAQITGITPQRLGSIHNRETVGNVERSQVQSSHITEYWFNRYEQIILDLNYLMLTTAKQLVKDGAVFQAVLDDYSYSVFSNNVDGFGESSVSLFPVNSSKYKNLENSIKQAAVQGLHQGQVTMSELIRLFKANNSSDLIVEAQKLEDEKEAKAEKESSQQNEQMSKMEEAKKQGELEKIQLENQHAIMIEEIRAKNKIDLKMLDLQNSNENIDIQHGVDMNSNGIKDDVELIKENIKKGIADDKLELEREKMNINKDLELKKLAIKNKEVLNKFRTFANSSQNSPK